MKIVIIRRDKIKSEPWLLLTEKKPRHLLLQQGVDIVVYIMYILYLAESSVISCELSCDNWMSYADQATPRI